MIVVANTSPICYALLIGCQDVLPTLFGQVTIPQAVRDELGADRAPSIVHAWIAHPPDWLAVQQVVIERDPMLDRLHRGEREAVILAERVRADLVLIDEKAARQAAAERGLNVAGLLGILDEAAGRGLIDLLTCVERLQRTTFRASPRLLRSLLDRHREAK